MFISGMGFFANAYDQAGMAPDFSTIRPDHIDSASRFRGRRDLVRTGCRPTWKEEIYGVEVLVLAAGAIACGLAPNIIWLTIFRIILGLGIGGDYPVSATIMSEYAGKKSRGMLVSLVFAKQAAGLIFGPLLAVALLSTSLSHDLIWRILLAFGAVPALAVYYSRRKLREEPRCEAMHKQKRKDGAKNGEFFGGFASFAKNRTMMTRLVGVSLILLTMAIR